MMTRDEIMNLSWRQSGKPLDHSGMTYIKSLRIIQWKWQIDWRDWIWWTECLNNYGQRFVTLYKEAVIKIIPKKMKWEKEKWLSVEALQIAEKTREVKGKGEKERYSHLNAEFQRITRRDKKAFLSNQCKEMEENNRMGKTRDLFKKIRDTKGTCKAGLNKGQKWYGPNRSRRY